MPRTIQEKLRDPIWWGEQVLHAVGGGLAALPFSLIFHFVLDHPALLVAGVFAGAAAGTARELWQNWRDAPGTNDVLDSQFDDFFFAVGAVIVSLGFAFA